jgi:hypothetical protein
MDERRISKEEWVELSKKLRERVVGHFTPDQLQTIDAFIQMAGSSASFDQVRQ